MGGAGVIDLEKVRKGLECCMACTSDDPFARCEECPYNNVSIAVQNCRAVLSMEALEILNELKGAGVCGSTSR